MKPPVLLRSLPIRQLPLPLSVLPLLAAACLLAAPAAQAAKGGGGGNPVPPTSAVLALEAELKLIDPTTELFGFRGGFWGALGARSFVASGDTAAAVVYKFNRLSFAPIRHQIQIFRRNAGAWVTEAVLLPPDPAEGLDFGVALALNGDTLAVAVDNPPPGASANAVVVPANPANPLAVRGVYIYRRLAGTWVQQARLEGSDALATTYRYGSSLSLSAGVLAVGAAGGIRTANGVTQETRSGAVYVFENQAGVWRQTARLAASPAGRFDNFGASGLAVSGDTLAAGWGGLLVAPNGTAVLDDKVRVFQRTAGAWLAQATLQPADQTTLAQLTDPLVTQRHSFNLFGWSAPLALDGNTLLVGGQDSNALGVGGGAGPRGKAYVFSRTAGTWRQAGVLLPRNRSSNDLFGTSIGLGAGVAAFGWGSTSNLLTYPKGSLFTQAGANWTETTLPTAPGVAYDMLTQDGSTLYSHWPAGHLVYRLNLAP